MIFRHVLMIGVLSALSFKHLKILTSQLVRILNVNFERILHEILSIDYKEAKKKSTFMLTDHSPTIKILLVILETIN